MRPDILTPLFAEITSLPGVGPRMAKLYERLVGTRVVDLCWHLPTGLVDRRYQPKLREAEAGRIATLRVRVVQHYPGASRRSPYKVICEDETGELELVFFHARGDYLQKTLPVGEERLVSGRLDRFNERLQMTHPDHIGELTDLEEIATVGPTYPLTAGLTPKPVAKAVTAALQRTVPLPEWLDPAHLKQKGWLGWQEALFTAQGPQSETELSPLTPARQRLAYDELLANQLALALIRNQQRAIKGRVLKGDGHLKAKVLAALPFALTGSQEQALKEITTDMASPSRMLRLLQGDVGSGKTVVALLAMVAALENGSQAALMAPTEILARQHHETLAPLAEAAGIKLLLLTGRDKGKNREKLLAQLADGSAQIAIGTHALFQEDVGFADLGLAIIDEQHRFGVHQRLTLAAKGQAVDVLVMTATPIPRTLVLTSYGDMNVSRLTEKPAGRKPIDTRLVSSERIGEVVQGIARMIGKGQKVYWVCPLVEESEKLDLAAAEERFAELDKHFPGRVALVHGKMKAKDKDAAMASFVEGDCDLLVATTVIEVGVNVPTATVMVIEHAERFGLAQLHQLRGRIGRGSDASTCLLLYSTPLGKIAKERLTIMRETDDGFKISEKDLELRGAGEVLGTKQSGLPTFKLADIAVHSELLATARDDAQLIMNKDAELMSERGKALRVLLYLFERDAAVRYLRSG
ncbi:ATP-dependent DNA helicase RecG [Rhodovibrionaceae bacterium A322]